MSSVSLPNDPTLGALALWHEHAFGIASIGVCFQVLRYFFYPAACSIYMQLISPVSVPILLRAK